MYILKTINLNLFIYMKKEKKVEICENLYLITNFTPLDTAL